MIDSIINECGMLLVINNYHTWFWICRVSK